VGLVHSYNRITEKPVSSISKGTDVSGVGSSEPARQRVRRGDEPLQTPEASVPSCCPAIPLGAESQEPVSPVAPDAVGGGHSERSEASRPVGPPRHYAQSLAISHTTPNTVGVRR